MFDLYFKCHKSTTLYLKKQLLLPKKISVHFHLSYRTERKLPHSSFPPSVLSPYGYPACSHPFRPINILKARAATHQADIFLPTKINVFLHQPAGNMQIITETMYHPRHLRTILLFQFNQFIKRLHTMNNQRFSY